jgi:stress response protein SCP2
LHIFSHCTYVAVVSGDSRTGEAEGDDEVVVVRLSQLPSSVKVVMITIHAYSGGTFKVSLSLNETA